MLADGERTLQAPRVDITAIVAVLYVRGLTIHDSSELAPG